MTIIERVAAERVLARRKVAASAVATGIGAIAAVLTLGAIVLGRGRWLELPAVVPFALWGAAAVLAVYAARRVPRRLGAYATDEAVARATESERGLRDGALVGLLQVAPAGGALARLRTSQLSDAVGAGVLAPRHSRFLLLNAAAALGATVVVLLGMVSSGGRYVDGWRALGNPFAAARGALLPAVNLDQTPAALLRGEQLTAVVSAEGRRKVQLSWRATGAAWRDTMLAVDDGRATLSLGAADAPVTLVASDGRSTSDSLVVAVHQRPFAGDVSIRAIYPAYLRMPPEVLTPEGALRFPEGTTLEITARTAGLANLALTDSRDSVRVLIEAGRVRARLAARASGAWQWVSTDSAADLPPALVLDVIPDRAPNIEIVSPSGDTLVSPDGEVRLVVAAMDDHGLSSVRLLMARERRTGERDGEDVRRISEATGERWLGELSVSLTQLDLNPGDAVSITAEARDAAPWGRVGTSRRLVLRVPTADEQRDAATDAADSAVDHAAAAVAAQKGVERRTSEAARNGARTDQKQNSQGTSEKGPGASFEAQERARELVSEQRAVGALADTLAKEAQRLAAELQKAGVLDSALGAQLKEVERLLQEAMTPEMRQQMRELDERRQQMSGEELNQALANMQQPQKSTLESLEKAYEMLRRAALEGKMQSLSDKASELSQQQKQFADSAASQAQNAGAAPPATAKELADRAAAIQRDAQELMDRLQKEQAEAAKSEVQNAAAEAQESARKMQEAVRQAMETLGADTAQQRQQGQQQQQQRAGQQQQAGQQAGQQGGQQAGQQNAQSSVQTASQQAADAMKEASQSFAQARQQQVDAWKRELTEALDRSIQETLQMARQQEQLGQQAQQGAGQQQMRAEQGALQQGVQQTAERVSEQGQKSALVSPNSQRAMDAARQRVEQATRDVNEGATGQQASQAMRDAADALRQAATSMARDRERAASSQSASGLPELMQQMRDMANQQGQINGQAASMLPSAGQMTAGSPEREAVQKLAERQREMAQKLEDAADADRTGKAEAMAREARQIAQQLERGALDPSVIDRQQRLFRRMLDAGRTLEQDGRDDGDRREARSGQGINADAPTTGTARGAAAVKYREPTYDELRGYTAEERRAIIEYFRRMNGKQHKQQ